MPFCWVCHEAAQLSFSLLLAVFVTLFSLCDIDRLLQNSEYFLSSINVLTSALNI